MSVTYLPSALRSSTFDPGHGLVLRGPLSGQTLGAGADIGRIHETACGRCGWWRRTCGEHYRTGVRGHHDTPGTPLGDPSAARRSALTALCPASDPGVPAESVLGRHVHVGAQRLPDGPRRLAVGEGLHDGAVAERAQHVVAGERPGIRRAELVVHQGPEVADPHHSSLPPARREPCRAETVLGPLPQPASNVRL